jgi:hypothetical protein
MLGEGFPATIGDDASDPAYRVRASLGPWRRRWSRSYLFDAEPGGIYESTSYTVFAGGRLEAHLADGTT